MIETTTIPAPMRAEVASRPDAPLLLSGDRLITFADAAFDRLHHQAGLSLARGAEGLRAGEPSLAPAGQGVDPVSPRTGRDAAELVAAVHARARAGSTASSGESCGRVSVWLGRRRRIHPRRGTALRAAGAGDPLCQQRPAGRAGLRPNGKKVCAELW